MKAELSSGGAFLQEVSAKERALAERDAELRVAEADAEFARSEAEALIAAQKVHARDVLWHMSFVPSAALPGSCLVELCGRLLGQVAGMTMVSLFPMITCKAPCLFCLTSFGITRCTSGRHSSTPCHDWSGRRKRSGSSARQRLRRRSARVWRSVRRR